MKRYVDDDLKEVLMYICIELRELNFYKPHTEYITYKTHRNLVHGRFTSNEEIREAIYTLQNDGIIKVIQESVLPVTRHHDDYEWEIEIIEPELEKALEAYAKKYSVKAYPTAEKMKHEEEVDWPDDFIWTGDNTFDLGEKGKLTFMPKEDNKRKIYFKMMFEAKDWVEVREMKTKTGETEQQTRIKLNQIKDKIGKHGLGGLIALKARNDRSKPGAYRLIPHPKRNS